MKKRLPYYIASILTMVLGFLFFTTPQLSMRVIGKMIGISLIIYSVIRTISMFIADKRESLFTLGILVNAGSLLLGILMILNTFGITAILGVAISIFIIGDAAWRLRIAFASYRYKLNSWWTMLLVALLNITLGVIALLNIRSANFASIRIISIALVSYAVLNILSLMFSSKLEKHRKE